MPLEAPRACLLAASGKGAARRVMAGEPGRPCGPGCRADAGRSVADGWMASPAEYEVADRCAG